MDAIEGLINDPRGRYEFARDTLADIHDWVDENEKISEKQITAVTNIARSKDREWEP